MNFKKFRLYNTHGDGKFSLNDFKKLGKNVIIESDVKFFYPNNIILGDNIYIGHNSIIKGYFNNEIVIGSHTWIGQSCFMHGAGGIVIGNGVGVGPGVMILSSSHKEKPLSNPIIFNELEFAKVEINDGADIGIGSIILPGIKIGEGSIIGAGSVVTKDVKDYCVVAGNPAKLIRIRK